MVQITQSSSFKRAYKKRVKYNKELEGLFWKKVEVFIKDPYDKSLRTHKLSGKLEGLWSFTVQYDCRVIFFFEDNEKVVFTDIGSHEEVY
jgi:toxin HigB-1